MEAQPDGSVSSIADAVIAATTIGPGPPEPLSTADPFSVDANSEAQATTIGPDDVPPTDTASVAASAAPTDTVDMASASSASSVALSSASMASPMSIMPTQTGVNEPKQDADKEGSGIHFKITYLIPLFVLLGLLFLLAVGGKIWGRIAFAKERALKRQERRRREAQQLANKQRNGYAQPWLQTEKDRGWAAFDAPPDTSMEMQRHNHEFDAMSDAGDEDEKTLHSSRRASPTKQRAVSAQHGIQLYDGPVPYDDESDGDRSEHDLNGPLSALGTHLAGQKLGQRAPPPPARLETERFGVQVAANSWWSVQWNKYTGKQGGGGSYDNLRDEGAASWVADQNSQRHRDSLAAASNLPKAGFLARMKQNIGWGYDGNSPAMNVENRSHATVLPPQAPLLWTRLPPHEYEDDAAHRLQPNAPFAIRNDDQHQNLDRSLPPTPYSPVISPLSRGQTQNAHSFSLSRSQTQAVRPAQQGDSISRSKTSTGMRRKPVLLSAPSSDEEMDDDEEQELTSFAQPRPKRFKSMSSVAVSQPSAAKLQRQLTFAVAPSAVSRRASDERSRNRQHRASSSFNKNQALQRKATVSSSKFSRQPTRQPVNFGDGDSDDDEQRTIDEPGSMLSTLDSFKVSRSRSQKRVTAGKSPSADLTAAAMTPGTRDGEIILDLLNQYSGSQASENDSSPALSQGPSSAGASSVQTEDEQEQDVTMAEARLQNEAALTDIDDLTSEIDSVLLSVIARSNTSKSFARPVGDFASPVLAKPPPPAKQNTSPSKPSTPLGRTATWRKENGQWLRTPQTDNEDDATMFNYTPKQSKIKQNLLASPAPLPTPPPQALAPMPRALLAGSPVRKQGSLSDSPSRASSTATRSTLTSAPSLKSKQSASTLSRQKTILTTSSSLANQPSRPVLLAHGDSQGNLRPEQQGRLKTQKFGTSHAHIGNDFFFASQSQPQELTIPLQGRRGTQSTVSSIPSSHGSTNDSAYSRSLGSASMTSQTSPSSASPTRRAAFVKRSSPQRYTARLATCDDAESEVELGDKEESFRLHTGKSIRTPAEKRREQQYAMDRVQSLVTRAHAARLNQSEPQHWMA